MEQVENRGLKLLQVQIRGKFCGTATPVAPNLCLTSAHTIGDIAPPGALKLLGADHEFKVVEVIPLSAPNSKSLDAAILRLDGDVQEYYDASAPSAPLFGQFSVAGFTVTAPSGVVALRSLLFTRVQRADDLLLLPPEEQLLPGMSGGPLVDLTTGAAIGLVKSNRGSALPLGGLIVPFDQIWRAAENLAPNILPTLVGPLDATGSNIPHWLALYPNPLRLDELQRIIDSCVDGNGCAITGPTGFGKSVLAAHAMVRLSRAGHKTEWFDLSAASTLDEALFSIAEQMGVLRRSSPRFLEDIRKSLQGVDVVVVDDVNVSGLTEVLARTVAGGVKIVSTSQRSGLQDVLPELTLGPAPDSDIASLLLEQTNASPGEAPLDAIENLAKLLGGWPLLGQIVAAGIRQYLKSGSSLAEAVNHHALQLSHISSSESLTTDRLGRAISLVLGRVDYRVRQRIEALAVLAGGVPAEFSIFASLWEIDEHLVGDVCLLIQSETCLLTTDIRTRSALVHQAIVLGLGIQVGARILSIRAEFVKQLEPLENRPEAYLAKKGGSLLLEAFGPQRALEFLLSRIARPWVGTEATLSPFLLSDAVSIHSAAVEVGSSYSTSTASALCLHYLQLRLLDPGIIAAALAEPGGEYVLRDAIVSLRDHRTRSQVLLALGDILEGHGQGAEAYQTAMEGLKALTRIETDGIPDGVARGVGRLLQSNPDWLRGAGELLHNSVAHQSSPELSDLARAVFARSILGVAPQLAFDLVEPLSERLLALVLTDQQSPALGWDEYLFAIARNSMPALAVGDSDLALLIRDYLRHRSRHADLHWANAEVQAEDFWLTKLLTDPDSVRSWRFRELGSEREAIVLEAIEVFSRTGRLSVARRLTRALGPLGRVVASCRLASSYHRAGQFTWASRRLRYAVATARSLPYGPAIDAWLEVLFTHNRLRLPMDPDLVADVGRLIRADSSSRGIDVRREQRFIAEATKYSRRCNVSLSELGVSVDGYIKRMTVRSSRYLAEQVSPLFGEFVAQYSLARPNVALPMLKAGVRVRGRRSAIYRALYDLLERGLIEGVEGRRLILQDPEIEQRDSVAGYAYGLAVLTSEATGRWDAERALSEQGVRRVVLGQALLVIALEGDVALARSLMARFGRMVDPDERSAPTQALELRGLADEGDLGAWRRHAALFHRRMGSSEWTARPIVSSLTRNRTLDRVIDDLASEVTGATRESVAELVGIGLRNPSISDVLRVMDLMSEPSGRLRVAQAALIRVRRGPELLSDIGLLIDRAVHDLDSAMSLASVAPIGYHFNEGRPVPVITAR